MEDFLKRAEEIVEKILCVSNGKVLVMDHSVLEELNKSGCKVWTVYQLTPESRDYRARKIQYKRVQMGIYQAEFRINTDFTKSLNHDTYLYSIKIEDEKEARYKAPSTLDQAKEIVEIF